MLRLITALLALILLAGCSASEPALTEEQLQKLDPALRHLVQNEDAPSGAFRYSTSGRADGATAYDVILRTNDPEALREAEVPVNSVMGGIITARLSVEEIRKAARLEAVTAIQNSPPGDEIHGR